MDDLYRPLGMNRADPVRRSLPRVDAPVFALAACAAIVVLGSAATSLLQPELRRVDIFAERAAASEAAMARAAASMRESVAATPLQPLGRTSVPAAMPHDEALPTITYPPETAGGYGRALSVRDPASLRQAANAADAPDEALIEASDLGPLPMRAADGRRPFDVYSVEPATDAGARVAIVVGGLGISQTGTLNAVERLPPAVTLGFAAAGNSLERWMRQARQGGHELLLQAPMEPFNYPDVSPGEHTLTAEDAAAARFADLHWALGRVTNYVGVSNFMGARLTGSEPAMRAFAAELTRRGLMFLDDGTSSRSLSRGAMAEAGGVHSTADVLIDATQEPVEIRKRLDTLERTARANGQAIGVASAFDVSVTAIADWIREAETRGIRVVPVSALANDPEAR